MSDTGEIAALHARLELTTEALLLCEERSTAGQLALELMHEIKNPLEALGHLTYLAAMEADDPDHVRSCMRMANEQMETLTQLVNQTLGFARASPAPRPIDLVSLAEAALRIHQRTIEAKRVHLKKEVAAGTGWNAVS
jgi:signal transduction histidine kinase